MAASTSLAVNGYCRITCVKTAADFYTPNFNNNGVTYEIKLTFVTNDDQTLDKWSRGVNGTLRFVSRLGYFIKLLFECFVLSGEPWTNTLGSTFRVSNYLRFFGLMVKLISFHDNL